ncbi:chromatin assembly factor 1 subunit A-A [Scaptodrosophila lebanonensis]|uniref:Chromatin assembly factor 1 subunit A-A n=1 Tax=Drosophila lebanonensis TaxID=7225 RepID=A0A6J2TWA1_DROLE|nr:chromatin assembly factor 1 subunit A-A [Scaptodrosophila lebanonensis]
MSAGLVKTPTVGRGKDVNSPNGSSSKKLVQTRLPFKLITPAAPLTPSTASASTAAAETTSAAASEPVVIVLDDDEALVKEPRKRKLSYGSDKERSTIPAAESANDQQLRRSNSKENLIEGVMVVAKTVSKKPKASEAGDDGVIELTEEGDDNNDEAEAVNGNKSKCVAGHSPLIQIKLPLKKKRTKRTKSSRKTDETPDLQAVKAAEQSYSSDDIEATAVELNPRKRAKVVQVESVPAKPEAMEIDEPVMDNENGNPAPKDLEKETNDQAKSVSQPESQIITESESKSKTDGENFYSSDEKSTSEAKTDGQVQSDAEVVHLDSNDEEKTSDSDSKSNGEQSSTDMEVETDTLNKTASDIQEVSGIKSKLTTEGTDAPSSKNLTPKQQKLLEQRKKAREEKERKLQEERMQKQQEREEREQAKKREREQKEEQRRKEREEKEEQKRKEREERERKRQAEVDSKMEEKRKRNEAKEEVQRKKDEERRRKEQEKEEAREKEELKKKRAAESFSKFFVQKQPKPSQDNICDHEQSSCDSGNSQLERKLTFRLAFRPFQVKGDMLLAPVLRSTLDEEQRKQLDTLVHHRPQKLEGAGDGDHDDDEEEDIVRRKPPTRAQLYLSELRLGRHKPKHTQRDAALISRPKDDDDEEDVQIVGDLSTPGMPILEEKPKQLPPMRAKYLHFSDNRRPPYYGTWRKRSNLIKARRPFGQDKSHFDYEIDSDCEWEEEEPGESLSASEDEKERESEEEDYEVDNEWFVPHGHLSDEEMQNDGEMEDGNTREAQKAKLQVMQQEFAQEMKKQTKKIKPRLWGPVWLDENGESLLLREVFTQTIDMYGSWQLEPLSLEPPPELAIEEEPMEEKASPLVLDGVLLQQLVRLIHGNSNSKIFLISEYLEYLKTQTDLTLPSKSLLREKFDEYATWKPVELGSQESSNNGNANPNGSGNGGGSSKKLKKPKKRLCWVVNADVLEKFQLTDLTLQNQWQYMLTPKISNADTSLREEKESTPLPDLIGTNESTPQSKTKPGITKFTKSLQELAKSQTSSSPTSSAASAKPTTVTATSVPKKRGTLLMSVPRDQQFHAPTKNALISQYLKKQSDEAKARKTAAASPTPVDDVVLLSD